MAKGATDYAASIKGIANISPDTRARAIDLVNKLNGEITGNKEAYETYLAASNLLPLFVEALKKDKPGPKLVAALKRKTKGKIKAYVDSKHWGDIIDILNDRHAFNTALTSAGVKLHARKLKGENGDVNISNADWQKIEKMLKEKGRGGSELRKLVNKLASPTAEPDDSGSTSTNP